MAGFFSLFNNYTFLIVASGSAILGIISGVSGTFAVLRKQSLLGDAVSHAALPGIALMFLLTGIKSTELLLLGAMISGLITTFIIGNIVKNSKVSYDSALALVMSVVFGLGMVFLTVIQRKANSNQAGITRFIFGQAEAMLIGDVYMLAIIAVAILSIVIVFWKEFKMFTFDEEFAQSVGYSPKKLNLIISLIIVAAIIAGLQTVGVILMSAMLIAPAVAARQWTDRLWLVVLLSAVFGAASGVIGTAISSLYEKMPTGPTIVVVVSVFVLISLMFAPNRGILWKLIRNLKVNAKFKNKQYQTEDE